MKILVPDIYQDFKCIGGECLKTCCMGWTILVDDDTIKKYKENSDPFFTDVLSHLTSAEGSNRQIIKLDDEEKCPFLNEKGLCNIVLNKGDDYIGYVCQTYPRIFLEYNDTIFATVCSSCPEVARMIIDKDDFISYSLDEIPDEKTYENVDWTLYNELINALVISNDIIQYIELPLSKRYEILLSIAEIIDKHIANKTISDIRKDLEIYKDKNFINSANKDSVTTGYSFIEIIPTEVVQNTAAPKYIKEYFSSYNIKEYISHIEASLNEFLEIDNTLTYTNLSTLFIFEFFMDVIKGIPLKKNVCKMITLMLLIQQIHLIDFSKKHELAKEDFVLGISMACSLLKHSSILNRLVDTLLDNNSDDEIKKLANMLI